MAPDPKSKRLSSIRASATNPALVAYTKQVKEDRLAQKEAESANRQQALASANEKPSAVVQETYNRLKKQEEEKIIMADPDANKNKNKNKNTTTTATKPEEGMSAAKAKSDTAASKKGEKVRLYSQVDQGFTFRVLKEYVDQFGLPDHKGKPMVIGQTERRSGLKEFQEAEKAKLAAMSDEERTEYAKKKREEKKAAKAEKEAKKKAELIEQLKREIAEGKV